MSNAPDKPDPDDPAMADDAFIPMRVGGVVIDPNTQVPVVILRGLENPRLYVPIFIGGLEATAIATVLAGVKLPRPMTHDLMVSLLDAVQCKVASVAITRLEGGTFFAELRIVDESGGELLIDSRPSDALALALRMEAPVSVARAVIAEAGAFAPDEEGEDANEGEGALMEQAEGTDEAGWSEADPDDLPDMPPEPTPPGEMGAPNEAALADKKKAVVDGPRSFFGEVKLEDLGPDDFGKYKM